MVRLKRKAPGYYEGTAETTVDGKPKVMKFVLGKAQTKAWYWHLEGEDAQDWYLTKKGALDALTKTMKLGFKKLSGYGLVPDK